VARALAGEVDIAEDMTLADSLRWSNGRAGTANADRMGVDVGATTGLRR